MKFNCWRLDKAPVFLSIHIVNVWPFRSCPSLQLPINPPPTLSLRTVGITTLRVTRLGRCKHPFPTMHLPTGSAFPREGSEKLHICKKYSHSWSRRKRLSSSTQLWLLLVHAVPPPPSPPTSPSVLLFRHPSAWNSLCPLCFPPDCYLASSNSCFNWFHLVPFSPSVSSPADLRSSNLTAHSV